MWDGQHGGGGAASSRVRGRLFAGVAAVVALFGACREINPEFNASGGGTTTALASTGGETLTGSTQAPGDTSTGTTTGITTGLTGGMTGVTTGPTTEDVTGSSSESSVSSSSTGGEPCSGPGQAMCAGGCVSTELNVF